MGRVVSVLSGDYNGFVHRLGKEGRRELVEIAAEAAGGATRLAEVLGVTPQAIYKFLNERAHPSDRVVMRILEFLSASAPSWARRRAVEVLEREMQAVVRGYRAALELLGEA